MILRVCATLWVVLIGTFASAQSLPAQYAVTGVAANDTLNIRADPDATSTIVEVFSPDATAVEILDLSDDGRWGLVGLPEGQGWVSMRYLTPTPTLTDTIPRPLRCSGTEPFWSFELTSDGPYFATPDMSGGDNSVISVERPSDGGYFVMTHRGSDAATVLIVQNGYCGDGMSDRPYGFRAMFYIETDTVRSVYSGCCTISGDF